MLNTEFLL